MSEKLISAPAEESRSLGCDISSTEYLEVDFDLHGFVGIRCVNATPRDVTIVARQLGSIKASLNREPDIVIRFVDHIRPSAPLRYLGIDDMAFTNDKFFVLRGKHKSRAKVQIPFDAVGKRCEIVCERGLAAVPELIEIVNQTALSNGFLPLNASAFNYRGVGVLVTGWGKGGKTETLLSFMANGAKYVGDEWIYLNEGGEQMFGIPKPIRIRDWYLNHLPCYRKKLGWRKRFELQLLNALVGGAGWLAEIPMDIVSAPKKLLKRVLPLLRKQIYVNWAPEKVFGNSNLALSGIPKKIFFVATHESQTITVEPIDHVDVVRHMIFSLQYEQRNFIEHYLKFRFAFPDRANELIDRANQLQEKMLSNALEGKQAYIVLHPYPVAIPLLFEAIRRRL